jgi:hypothetical protein
MAETIVLLLLVAFYRSSRQAVVDPPRNGAEHVGIPGQP